MSRHSSGWLICACLLIGASALAQDQSGGPVTSRLKELDDKGALFRATVNQPPAAADVNKGRLIAMGGTPQGADGMACFRCHGTSGAGDGAASFPRLAQLPAWYMSKQLDDYASGTRPSEIMAAIAKRLSVEERAAVSVYYALAVAPVRLVARDEHAASVSQWGGILAISGSAERGIPGCINCHGADGEGLPPSVPNLASQHTGYTAAQLHLWKDGVRKNDPMNVMATIARKMTDADIEAVAAYYARISLEDATTTKAPANGASRPRSTP